MLRNDQEAFRELWELFERPLRKRLLGRIRSHSGPIAWRLTADADDILQEVFSRGFARIADFDYRGPGSCLAWFRAILDNLFVNRLEHWTAQKRSGDQALDATRDAAPGPGPASRLGLSEDEERVAIALRALDEPCQLLLELRFYSAATWVEIAETFGREEGKTITAAAARMRGKKCLRAFLDEYHGLKRESATGSG